VGALIGARIGACDFADGTVGTAIVTTGRTRYALGKTAALVAGVVVFSAAVGLTGAAFGAAVQRGWPELGALPGLIAPFVFATVCTLLSALLALVLASSIRSVKATVTILVGLFLSPSVLPSDLGTTVARLQPYYLVTQFMPATFADLKNTTMLQLHAVRELSAVPAALVTVALVGVYAGVTMVIWQRREITA
jgi:hypothetical protein